MPGTRLVLVTGAASTSVVAAATALRLAQRGVKTALTTTDRASRLPDVVPVRPRLAPVDVAPGLSVVSSDASTRTAPSVRSLADEVGLDASNWPGVVDTSTALALAAVLRGVRTDVLVVDAGPLDTLVRTLDAVGPARSLIAAVLPVLGRSVSTPPDPVGPLDGLWKWLGAAPSGHDRSALLPLVQALDHELADAGRSLDAAEVHVVGPAREDVLALYGHGVAARVETGVDTSTHWTDVASVAESLWGPLPGVDPLAVAPAPPVSVEPTQQGFTWCLTLPGVDASTVTAARRDDDLIVTVGAYRRAIGLSSVLRRCTVTGAWVQNDVLRVGFRPDPAQWPGMRGTSRDEAGRSVRSNHDDPERS